MNLDAASNSRWSGRATAPSRARAPHWPAVHHNVKRQLSGNATGSNGSGVRIVIMESCTST